MDVAALVTWLVTAAGGFVLLTLWVSHGGLRSEGTGSSHLPPAVIFGHFLLAAVGLLVWIGFVISDESAALAWTAFGILLPVALLGFVMLFRWLGDRRAPTADATNRPAEQHFPVSVVGLHGLLAVTTLVLVLVAALSA